MPVDADQLKRRIKEVQNAKKELRRLTKKPYEALSLDSKYAIRYHIIILAEALGSICVQIAVDNLGQKPFSYSECFELLDQEGICDNCANNLRQIVGLRNLLAHQYWTIDDQKVYLSIKNDFKGVDEFFGGSAR
jgi:uncharacterized protein YutE (UPF0331/DUF86 family)